MMPPAASRVYFKFYSCKDCPDHEKWQVKPIYAPLSSDDDKQHPLIVDKENQDADGLMPTWALEIWINKTLKRVAGEMGLDTVKFEDICAAPYEKKLPYDSAEEYR